jgi:hypothetical protein
MLPKQEFVAFVKTASKVMLYSRFFHDLVCHVPGLYFSVNRHLDIGGDFEPHVMISPAVMVKNKPVLFQDFPDLLFILRHYLNMYLGKPFRLEVDFNVRVFEAQKVGNRVFHALHEGVKGTCLQGEARYVFTGREPDIGFVIPG